MASRRPRGLPPAAVARTAAASRLLLGGLLALATLSHCVDLAAAAANEFRRWGPTGDQKDVVDIFTKTGTDKRFPHNYDVYYGRHLAPFRREARVRLLEVGANSGASLAAWGHFFASPEAIHGVSYVNPADRDSRASADVSRQGANLDCARLAFPHCGKIRLFHGDQSDAAFLRGDLTRLGAGFANGSPPRTLEDPRWRTGGYDIIIDDGSHFPPHMVISFQELFPLVRPGGLYVIEDIETNYWKKNKMLYGYRIDAGVGVPFSGTHNTGSAVEKFKEIVDLLQKYHAGVPYLTVFGEEVDGCISEISFGHNNIIIRKETPYEQTRRPHVATGGRPDRQSLKSWAAKARASNPPRN